MFPVDSDCVGWDDHIRTQMDGQTAEIARLRAALQAIVDNKATNPTAWEIAKTALTKRVEGGPK